MSAASFILSNCLLEKEDKHMAKKNTRELKVRAQSVVDLMN